MTPETAHALPQAQREAPGHGSGPTDPPQASHGQRSTKLTAFQLRVLRVLADAPEHPENLYRLIWPDGKYAERNFGPARGGPSRGASAVNWHLGRMQRLGLVERLGQSNQPWRITQAGKRALG